MAFLLALTLLTGCLGAAETSERSRGARGPVGVDGAPAATERQQGPELRARVQRVLDARARAVRRGDEEAFLAQLGGGRAWRERQRLLFDNLRQLPWGRFSYEVQDTDWLRPAPQRAAGQVLLPQVTLRTRLLGFDSRDVRRTVGFVVVVVRGDRVLLTGDRDAGGERLLEGAPSPWDLARVHVQRGDGVLGVFDDAMLGTAPEVMTTLVEGVREVDDVVPFDWSRSVVAYVVRDRAVLDTFTDAPGGSVDLLGALTFPVPAVPGRSARAASRMLLLPSSVEAGQPFLGRIVRHELSHVAVAERDDGAPTWFSEGLAEYVGAREVPTALRRIPTEAVRRARGPVVGMPGSEAFNGPDQDWHYALSWMAVDALVAARGEDVLWRLLDAFDPDAGADADRRGAEVLQQVTGLTERRLARLAAQRITALYG